MTPLMDNLHEAVECQPSRIWAGTGHWCIGYECVHGDGDCGLAGPTRSSSTLLDTPTSSASIMFYSLTAPRNFLDVESPFNGRGNACYANTFPSRACMYSSFYTARHSVDHATDSNRVIIHAVGHGTCLRFIAPNFQHRSDSVT